VGTKGTSNCKDFIRPLQGQGQLWRFRDEVSNPYQQEHQDLMASIRAGKPINEAQNIAESTLTGIMGRDSAYTGKTLEWDQVLIGQTRLGPEKYEFGKLPFPEVPMPGEYKVT